MRWLEEQLQEEGPQPWPVLATQLPAAWGDTARQLVERLPDATHRHKLLSSQAPAMLASDLQELGFIVLDMELDTQQVLSADYAAQAGQDPSPDNMAALMAAQARIKTLQTEKTLLLQQQRGKP
jgi:hypothetical protein